MLSVCHIYPMVLALSEMVADLWNWFLGWIYYETLPFQTWNLHSYAFKVEILDHGFDSLFCSCLGVPDYFKCWNQYIQHFI